MLRDTAVDLIMKRLGNSTDLTLRDDIIVEMAQAQATVLEGDVFHPWFLVSEEASNSTNIGDERVPLPVNFVALWNGLGLYRYDATLDDPYVEMVRDDWDDIKSYFNYADKPTHWDIGGEYLLMRPVADAEYPLRLWYIAKGESLEGTYGDAANIENVWLKHASDWLIGETGLVIAEQYLQHREAALLRWASQASRGRERIRLKNVEMEETLKQRIMGGNYNGS